MENRKTGKPENLACQTTGATSVKVLISSQHSNSTGVSLALDGVGKSAWRWSVSVVDAAHLNGSNLA
jgi:hypothetical protein